MPEMAYSTFRKRRAVTSVSPTAVAASRHFRLRSVEVTQ